MVRRIIEHRFGQKPKRIVPRGGGLSNLVFQVKHDEGEFVVRICPASEKIDAYIKEQWAVTKAREVGVPTPEILEVGNEIVPHPYMISWKISGQEATFHPERTRILREMGGYAARIHSIPTTGFGQTFDWSKENRSRHDAWSDFLAAELDLPARLEVLAKYRMLAPQQIETLRSILEGMAKPAPKPMLNHGDLRLKNVLVNKAGKIAAIIDWENCISNIAPQWELSIALHDLAIDEKQDLLAGYGLPEKKVIEIAPVVKALNLINYAPEIERLVQLKDVARIEQYRTRLSGAFDLYSI